MVTNHKARFDFALGEHCLVGIKTPASKKEKEKNANAGTVKLCYISIIIIIIIMEKEESGINGSRNLGLRTIVKLLLP